MLDNELLNLKDLSLKTITLLGLASPNRGSELTELGLEFMSKTESTFIFHLIGPVKHSKQGKRNKPIEFRKFEPNSKLCPMP